MDKFSTNFLIYEMFLISESCLINNFVNFHEFLIFYNKSKRNQET